MAARARSVSPPKKGPPAPLNLSSGSGRDHHHTLPLSPASQREFSPGAWPGSANALRGRTMKEYDQQIADLEKENFHLKLRIYFLEEKFDNTLPSDTVDLHKLNVQLEVEVEVLKKELQQKHRLLEEALSTLERLEQTHKQELAALRTKSSKERSLLEKKLDSLEKGAREALEAEVRDRLAGPLDAAVHSALLRATLAARDGDKDGIAAARAQLKASLARALLDGESLEEDTLQDFKDNLLEDFICLKEELKRKDEMLQTIQEEQASREAELKDLKEELKTWQGGGTSPEGLKQAGENHQEVSKLFQRIREQDAIIEDLQAKLASKSAEVPWSELESDRARLTEISGTAQDLGHQLARSVQTTVKSDSPSSFRIQDCVDKLDLLMERLAKKGFKEKEDHPPQQQPPFQNDYKILRSKTLLNNLNSSVDQSLDSLDASQFTIDSLNARTEDPRPPFQWPKVMSPQEPDQGQMERLKDLLGKARNEVHDLQSQLKKSPEEEQWKRRSLSDFGNSHSVTELREEIALLVLRLRQMARGSPQKLATTQAGRLHGHLEELSVFLGSLLGRSESGRRSQPAALPWGTATSSDTDNLVLLLQPDPLLARSPGRQQQIPEPGTRGAPWSSDSDVWSEPDRDVSLQRLGVPEGRSQLCEEPYFEPRGGTTSTATEGTSTRRGNGQALHKGPRTSKWRHKCETYLHSLVTLTRGLTIDLSHHRTLGSQLLTRLPSHHPKELVSIIRKHGKTMEDLEDRLEEVIYNNKRVQELLKEKLCRGNEFPSSPEEVTAKYGQLLDKLYACRDEIGKKSENITLLEQNVAELKTARAQTETELAMTRKQVSDLESQLEMKDEELSNSKNNQQAKACNCWQWSIQRKLKGSLNGVQEEFKKKMEAKESETPKKHKEACKQAIFTNRINGKTLSDQHEVRQKEDWWKRKVEESEKKVENLKIGQERQMRANEHTISRLHFDLSAKDCEIAQLQKRVAQLKEELLKNISSVSQMEVERAERMAELNVSKAKLVEMEERCIWLQKELLAANTEKMEAKESAEKSKEQEIQKLIVERDHLKEEVERLAKELEQASSLQDGSSLRSSSDICSVSRSWTKSSFDNLKGTEDYSKRLLVALTAEMRYLQNELGHRSHVNRRLRNKLRRYEETRQAGGMSTSEGSLSMSDSASSAHTSNSFAFCKDRPPVLRLALKTSTEDSDLWSLPTSQGDSGPVASGSGGLRAQFSPDLGIESDSAAWLGTSPPKSDASGYGRRRKEELDLLKQLLEDSLEEIASTSAKVKELLFSAATSAFKNRQYNTLMEVDHSCQNIRIWIEKGKNLIGCFWIAMSEDPESSCLGKEMSSLKEQLQLERKKNTDLSNCLKITKKEKTEMEQAISWHLSKTCKMLTEAKENLLREKAAAANE